MCLAGQRQHERKITQFVLGGADLGLRFMPRLLDGFILRKPMRTS